MALVDPVILVFSFTAGAIAFINPCGIAMIPAYISFYLGLSSGGGFSIGALAKGALMGIFATLGFMAVFGGAGIILSLAGVQLIRYVPWIAVAIGVGVAFLGLLLVLGKGIYINWRVDAGRLVKGKGGIAFIAFGVAYAFASLSCTIPVFLYVALQAISTGGFLSATMVFLSYALGMGVVMILFTEALVVLGSTLMGYIYRVLPFVNRLAGLVMIGAGAYIVYFQVFVGGLIG